MSELAQTVASGGLLLAALIAFAAGVLSFLSPCVLPLAPGYLSYVTGLTGAEIAEGGAGRRSRVLVGSLLFVLGFSIVFVSYGLLFGGLGSLLLQYQDVIMRVLGVVVIVMGLAFMGIIPGLQREWRMHRIPSYSLWGAPILGILFGLGWTPCIGPTLTVVQTLAFSEASAARGAILSFVYCLGLGLPFILLGLAFRYAAGTLSWVRQHYVLIMRIGGGMLVVIGVLLVTGIWSDVTIWMRTLVPGFETPL
ncbi:MAG: cytochrome c biogenesis CcdA family protein [Actinomycetota bacterium]